MKKSVPALVILILCGFLANVMAPRLFLGFNYLLGSIPVLITLRYFGLFWGTVAGFTAVSYTYVLWGHPYAIVWLALEIVFVGILMRRNPSQSIVLYNTVYWPILGIPLLWIFFKFVMKLPFVGTLPAALMFWFTGITNSLCAQIIMDWTPIARWIGKPEMSRLVTIRRAVFQLMMIIVVVPAVFVLVINGRNTVRQYESTIVEKASETSEDMSTQIRSSMLHIQDMLDKLGHHIVNGELSDANIMKELLSQRYGITDVSWSRSGKLSALSVIMDKNSAANSSDIIKLGDVIITADGKSVILIAGSGSGRGLPIGLMDPSYISRVFQGTTEINTSHLLTIVDRNNRIVYTDNKKVKGETHYRTRFGGDTRMLANGVYQFLPYAAKYITLWSRVQRSWYAREMPVGNNLGWTVILEIPFAFYQKELLSWTSGAVLVLLFFILATMAVARYFSGRFSNPIRLLADMTTGLDQRIYEGTSPSWPGSTLQEISTLIENFKQTAGALLNRFKEVTEARDHLEERVRERTNELREAKEQAELVYRLVPSAICVLDLNKNVIIWNNKAGEITGFKTDEVLGKKCSVFCSDLCDTANCPLESNSIPMPVMMKQTAVLTKDGRKLTVLKNLDYLRDSGGNPVGLIESFNDITEQKKMEEQLRQAQKMEAIGTLTGGIAHDFNNMLNIILGYSQLIMADESIGSEQKEQLSRVLEASDRAKSLTQNLLSFSRPVKPNIEALDLNVIVSQSQKLFERLVPESIEFVMNLSAEPLTVFADRGQLGQVLLNLVTNARDAISGNGKISINTEKKSVDEKFSKINKFENPGEYAVLTVSDTGYGMSEEVSQRIFEPFYTTKGIGQGTGLGMSIVFGIIKQQKGYIKVNSILGEGTSISVYLPLHTGEKDSETVLLDEEVPQGGHETILLAEDEKGLRQLNEIVLEGAGYRVIPAADGAEALKKFIAAPDSVDLLLLDVIMPRMNGRDTAEEIRKIRKDMPVVFISGYTDDILEQGGFSEKGYSVLQKPVNPREMLATIRKELDRK